MQKTASKVRVGERSFGVGGAAKKAASPKPRTTGVAARKNAVKKPVKAPPKDFSDDKPSDLLLTDGTGKTISKTAANVIGDFDPNVSEDAVDDADGEEAVKKPAPTAKFQIFDGVSEASPWFKFLFHGEHKAGKTILAASVADVSEMNDVLYIDVDGSMKSIIPSGAVENYGNLSTVRVKDYPTFMEVYKFLVAHCEARIAGDADRMKRIAEKVGIDPRKRFRTVVIDTINNVEKMNHEHIYGTKDAAITREVEQGDWGKVNKHSTIMTDLLRKFRDIDMNVVMLCHSKYAKNKAKISNWEPDLQGALAGFIQRNIDMVGFMMRGLPTTLKREDDADRFIDDDDDGLDDLPGKAKKAAPKRKREVVRTIHIQPTGPFSASSRLTPEGLLKYENVTMADIYGSIREELREANKNAA